MNITIIDDDALEWNQDFILSLTSTDTDVIHEQNNKTVIIIVDNDSRFGYLYIKCFKLLFYVDVTLSVPVMTYVDEGDGLVQICATLSAIESIERNFTVALATTSGTGKYRTHIS